MGTYMGTKGATVGFGLIILLVSTAVGAESPPTVDYGKPIPPPCPKNEIRRCQNTCPPDYCVTLYAAFDCIANQTCVNGCYCKNDYLRIGRNGPCVPRDQCPPVECVDDPNARRGSGDKCGKTCADYNSNPICPKRSCRNDGCDCKEGYIHDTNQDKCVLPKDCTKPCKPHERWSPCLMGECVAKTCEDLGKPLACPANAVHPCPGGCICDYGYVRAKNGTCIDAKTCPPNKCGKNEEYYCGPSCPDNEASCSKPNPPTCINKRCEFKCFCKKGYVRDDKNGNVCIPADKCPINCTKKHEVYFDCLAGQCGPKKCDDLGRSLSCPGPGRGPCPGGCMCEQGYLRDINGNCIKIENCPPKPCGGNQTWMSPCDTPCPYPRCPRDDKPPPPCIKIEPCYPGCQCKLNYLRNSRGECILAPDCPPVNCTRPNEMWDGCPSACLAEGCDNINNQPTTCNTLIWLCSPRCVCKKGHFRNKDGICIPASQCPSYCKDPNASWRDCRDICPGTCQNPKPICMGKVVCRPGCQCKKGYVLDKPGNGGKCIKIEKCPVSTTTTTTTTTTPAPPKCKSNEHWTDCLPGQCKPKTCVELIKPAPCTRVMPPCPGGCICDDGYVWDTTGHCIKKKNCPINCTKKHEVYFNCLAGRCGPKTCDDLGRSLPCPGPGRGPCPGGCICEQGYLRDVNGNCIKIENCPPKPCGGNQTWMSPCNTPCPYPRCPRDDKPPPPCVKIEPCYPGCQCKLNYLRNSRGECILAPDCPPVNCTRPNEMWDGCPSTCLAEGCDNINNQPTTCNTLIWLCSPRCVCKKGHFRNKDGICIPASQCPSYCKDPNASWRDCRDICPGTCQNPKPICMSKVACRPGCQCKEGYVLDKPGDGGKCIKIKKCSGT